MGIINQGVIHEGEYVLVPARAPLPISTTSSTPPIPDSTSKTPHPDGARPLKGSPAETLPLVHKWSHTHSVLCVVPSPSKQLIFCGTQDSNILVYDLRNYSLKHVINCGRKQFATSVLCLSLSPDEKFLFSAGSDSLVKIWDLSPFDNPDALSYHISCTHIVYSLTDIGDIFSIAWSEKLSALFIGAQNASIMWVRLPLNSIRGMNNGTSIEKLPHFRFDRFFDSKGPGGMVNRVQTEHYLLRSDSHNQVNGPHLVEIAQSNVIRFAHFGYVYCMEFLTEQNAPAFCDLYRNKYHSFLVTCGGDGNVKLWGIKIDEEGYIRLETIELLENDVAILSMHVIDSSICVGLSDSSINAWDLTTFQLTRSFRFISEEDRDDEVLSLCMYDGCIYKATNMGGLCKFSIKLDLHDDPGSHQPVKSNITIPTSTLNLGSLNVDDGSVFAVTTFHLNDSAFLLSGGSNSLCLWNITNVGSSHQDSGRDLATLLKLESTVIDVSNEHMLASLKKIISYMTISKYPSLYLEDSRLCAQFLNKLLMSFGAAEPKLLPVPHGNPVVFGRFKRNDGLEGNPTQTLLWYGHYDVVEARADKEYWSTDPFTMVAKDGNLYARGVSDNKGPTLAAIYAVLDLYKNKALPLDVVFVIEGEEECGSVGFQEVINQNKAMIGNVDWILLSNSYWLGDETPCLNYGLRGIVNASVTVSSEKPDRHSGVDGGVSKEPTMDLIQILGELMCTKTKKIKIPGFYDDVLPLDETELKLYQKIKDASISSEVTHADLETLLAKWRNPSLTVHRIDVSGPKNNTVIPQTAQASVSIRVVPNQTLLKIKESLVSYLTEKFNELNTDNLISIDIFHEAEPWLGDPNNFMFRLLYEKVKENWGPSYPDPLFIREGGSIPSIRFLEKAFDAPAAQIPCGQGSDNAHLKDEKLRITNLFKLRDILKGTFEKLGN